MNNIQLALTFLLNELKAHLSSGVLTPDSTVPSSFENIRLGNIVDQNDDMVPDKLIISLVNIEEERIAKSQRFYRNLDDPAVKGNISNGRKYNPEIRLNLYVLFTYTTDSVSEDDNASTASYEKALRVISNVVGCFQKKNVFTTENTAGSGNELDASIGTLIVELTNYSLLETNHLWGYLGAKYMPSVLYKVRMLVVQESAETVARRIETTEVVYEDPRKDE